MRVLLRRLSRIVTFDDDDRELEDADILIDGERIEAVAQEIESPSADHVIDGSGLIALPGLVNSHQHLYQAALRAIPALERVSMGPWLAGVGGTSLEWWRAGLFGAKEVFAIARAALAESLLGGITTMADQHYFFPGEEPEPYVEATFEAAEETGLRLHAARGTITLGRSDGGAADDALVERVDDVVRRCESLIDRYHDPKPFARTRIALAPCGRHADLPETFEAFAALAQDHEEVRLHTHLYEVIDTEVCRERYGISPWEFLKRHRWAGAGTWLAHVNDIPIEEVPELAEAGVGVSHLIAPGLRLGWGLAPVREFLDSGVTLGFGTTGSASNDGANMLGDLRVAALAHRPGNSDPGRWPSARELLRMATRGSAECLGRPDLGLLAPGKAADVACWDLRGVDRIGVHDPVAGLLLTGLSDRASLVMIAGELLVEAGEPTRIELDRVAADARAAVPSAV